MVPPMFPAPGLLVTLTGLTELAGALALVWGPLVRVAAIALAVLLVAMLPANVHAARARLAFGNRPAMALHWRVPLQIFWIACLLWVARTAG